MPLQKIETIDEPRSRAEAQGGLFDLEKAHLDDFRNMLVWGDNKLVMTACLGSRSADIWFQMLGRTASVAFGSPPR